MLRSHSSAAASGRCGVASPGIRAQASVVAGSIRIGRAIPVVAVWPLVDTRSSVVHRADGGAAALHRHSCGDAVTLGLVAVALTQTTRDGGANRGRGRYRALGDRQRVRPSQRPDSAGCFGFFRARCTSLGHPPARRPDRTPPSFFLRHQIQILNRYDPEKSHHFRVPQQANAERSAIVARLAGLPDGQQKRYTLKAQRLAPHQILGRRTGWASVAPPSRSASEPRRRPPSSTRSPGAGENAIDKRI